MYGNNEKIRFSALAFVPPGSKRRTYAVVAYNHNLEFETGAMLSWKNEVLMASNPSYYLLRVCIGIPATINVWKWDTTLGGEPSVWKHI